MKHFRTTGSVVCWVSQGNNANQSLYKEYVTVRDNGPA